MKKRMRAFLANSWMAKTEENVLLKGKVFLVRASGGSDVALEMIGKWYVVENRVRGFFGGIHEGDVLSAPEVLENKIEKALNYTILVRKMWI